MAPFILKSEGGLAETEEEAAANAAAAGVPYKPSRKSKKQDSSSNVPLGEIPGAMAANQELNPPSSMADLQIE